MKNILVVTYYWPPSGGPGVQRVLKFCKYLPEFGWRPIILTVSNGDFPVYDNSLEIENKRFEIFKSKSISFHKIFNFFTRKNNTPTFQLSKSKKDNLFIKFSRWIRLNVIIPDGRIGWYFSAVNKGEDILKRYKIDVIFSSAPPYTAHLIAKKLSISNAIPWVADFRDPWTNRFYNYENKRSWITEKLDKALEKSVIDSAHKRITVSKDIANHYNKPFSIIHNGYDEDDFKNIISLNKNQKTIISYLGTMTKSQNPKNFFKVISNLNDKRNEYLIELIGNIHPDIKFYIQKKGYNKFINFISYVDHKEAIQRMAASNFLLLSIPNSRNNKGIVTGKLFEYIRSMTKIIMIGPKEGEAANIIKETYSGSCFEFTDKDEIYDFFLGKDHHEETRNFKQYERKNLTSKLVKILNFT